MNFNENYFLSQQEVCLDRLDNQLFFSSVNSILTNPSLIKENRIKYLFTTGISVNDFINAVYNNDNDLLKNITNELTIINLDTVAGQQQVQENDDTLIFKRHHTQKLYDIISYLANDARTTNNYKNNMASNLNNNGNEINRYLSPIPDKLNVLNNLYGDLSYYVGTNEFNDTDVTKFKTFNDLLTIIKAYNQQEKVLIISENGDDYDLITYLISSVLKLNPSYNVYDALKFLNGLTGNFENLNSQRIIWYNGLLSYYELIRANELYWGNINVNDCNSKSNFNIANTNSCSINSRSSSTSPKKRRENQPSFTNVINQIPSLPQTTSVISTTAKRGRFED